MDIEMDKIQDVPAAAHKSELKAQLWDAVSEEIQA